MSKTPTSPFVEVGGMAFFPRMLSKIKLHAAGELPEDYHANLGKGGDRRCCSYLQVSYDDLKERVLKGGSDEEILEWCYQKGRRLNEDDTTVWTGFITKLGWNDFASDYLKELKEEAGIANRDDIRTLPELMEWDEGQKA